jgi:hypothetical protein
MQRFQALSIADCQASPRMLDEALAVMISPCWASFVAGPSSAEANSEVISSTNMHVATVGAVKAAFIFVTPSVVEFVCERLHRCVPCRCDGHHKTVNLVRASVRGAECPLPASTTASGKPTLTMIAKRRRPGTTSRISSRRLPARSAPSGRQIGDVAARDRTTTSCLARACTR